MSIQIALRNSLELCFVILFLLCSYAFNQNSLSQAVTHSQSEDPFKLRVDVNLVTTDIAVMGNIVRDFTRDDFIVYDNNVVQPLSYFSQHFSHNQLPIAVVLLLATNGCYVGRVPQIELNEHNIAATSALRQLKSEDQVVLYAFLNGHYQRLSDLEEDRMKVVKLLRHMRFFENNRPSIYTTINKATKYLKENFPHRRRAIILISDNYPRPDTGSMLDPVGTRDRDSARSASISRTRLLESSTILCDIVFVPSESKSSHSKSDSAVREMAEETGGEVIEIKAPLSVTAALENAITRLRMQYTLGFNPSDRGLDGQFHNLKVRFADETRCPDCRIISRSGYYSGVGVSTPLPLPNKAERKAP
jgi:VWFA-related protein